MPTRGRSESSGVQTRGDCPICYSVLSPRTEVRPFQCDHGLCQTCSTRMQQGSDHRCPTCRAPRKGMSREQAEPPPDRNSVEPSFSELLASLNAHQNGDVPPAGFAAAFGPPPASLGAGAYGLQSHLNGQRFRTGYAMFFPTEPPTSLPIEAPLEPVMDPVFEAAEQAQTLEAILGSSNPAIQALLNLPAVSLADWHRILGPSGGRRPQTPYARTGRSSRSVTTPRNTPATRRAASASLRGPAGRGGPVRNSRNGR